LVNRINKAEKGSFLIGYNWIKRLKIGNKFKRQYFMNLFKNVYVVINMIFRRRDAILRVSVVKITPQIVAQSPLSFCLS